MTVELRLVSLVIAMLAVTSITLAQDGLSVKASRAGGLYTPGEAITVGIGGAKDQVTVQVSDYYKAILLEQKLPAGADGKASITLGDKSPLKLGWYQVKVASAGKQASTTFAVLPAMKEAVPARQSRFGMIVSPTGTLEQLPDIARSLRLAGVRWVDIDIPLAHLNPKEGQFEWEAAGAKGRDHFDAFARACHKEGLVVMLKFVGQADWISAKTDKDVHAYWDQAINLSPPADYEKWAKVVTAVVKRYADICDVWEVGNEPEGHGYFKGTDDDYMKYLEVTSKAIRAAQPKATIVAASMYNGGGVLTRLVKRPELFDIMSVHYLTGPWGDISPLERYTKALRDAGTTKVIWNTESRGRAGSTTPKPGETSHMGGKGADNQSPTKAYVRNFALGIPRVFVFSWNMEEGPGLVNVDYTPLWAAVEYRTLADQTEGAEFVEQITLNKDLSVFHFKRGEDHFLVAWSDVAGVKQPVVLTAGKELSVTDVMGNTTSLSVQAGKASLAVGYQPVFIHGLPGDFKLTSGAPAGDR